MNGLPKAMITCLVVWMLVPARLVAQDYSERRVVVKSGDWELIGDLVIPASVDKPPVILMLNKANGNRVVYEEMAGELAQRGLASLRLDLRGHGESTNAGKFVPYEVPRSPLIWDSEVDVIAAVNYLKSLTEVDPQRIGIVGGSYSGEEMAEAARLTEYVQTYVALSPGSFSDESIAGIDESKVPWLFVAANNERHLAEITADVQEKSKSVELLIVPGTAHASNLLIEQEGLSDRIATWLYYKLAR